MNEPETHNKQSNQPKGETRLIAVEGRVYAVQIVPVDASHNAPHLLPTPFGQLPRAIQTPIPQTLLATERSNQRQTITTHTSAQFIEQVKLLLWLLAGVSAIALFVLGIARLLAPAAPVPVTPAAPQTVIVQPAAPEKHRYRTRECRPVGAFGWGQSCNESEGWE